MVKTWFGYEYFWNNSMVITKKNAYICTMKFIKAILMSFLIIGASLLGSCNSAEAKTKPDFRVEKLVPATVVATVNAVTVSPQWINPDVGNIVSVGYLTSTIKSLTFAATAPTYGYVSCYWCNRNKRFNRSVSKLRKHCLLNISPHRTQHRC